MGYPGSTQVTAGYHKHKFPWVLLSFLEFPWAFMSLLEFPWVLMKFKTKRNMIPISAFILNVSEYFQWQQFKETINFSLAWLALVDCTLLCNKIFRKWMNKSGCYNLTKQKPNTLSEDYAKYELVVLFFQESFTIYQTSQSNLLFLKLGF